MLHENHVFRLPAELGGLQCSVNRYRNCTCSSGSSPCCNGVCLVFAHCTSAHKEQWEPSIQRVFELSNKSSDVSVCEAWSVDCLNHGDSAVLNEAQLSGSGPLTIKDYATLLQYLVNSFQPIRRRDRVVAVGHSSSTTAWTLASVLQPFPYPPATPSALILVEPVMLPPPVPATDPRIEMGKKNVAGVLKRRDRWADAGELRAWLGKRFPYKAWDARALAIYIDYGFRTMKGPDGRDYVTYKCPLAQEVGFYTHEDHVFAGQVIAAMCSRVKVHCVFGQRPEMVSLESRRRICDASRGHCMASVSIVENAGHLAVQENPDGVATAIFDVLSKHPIEARARPEDCSAKASL